MKNILKNKVISSLILIFLIGLITGILFYIFIKNEDKLLIKEGIKNYIELLNNNKFSYQKGFINSFMNSFILVNIIFVSSIFIFLIPITYFINFYKGFLIGFLFTLIISIYKLKGIFYFFIFMFPHEFINVLLCITLSIIVINYSRKLIYLFKNDKSIKIKTLYLKFISLYLIVIIIIVINSILEIFLNTYLLKLIL